MAESITTDRLILRPFRSADAPDIVRFIGNINVARWLTTVPHPYGDADAAWFIHEHCQDKPLMYAVTRADALIGGMTIDGQLGYWLGQPFWGQGFATEAGRAIVARYFTAASTPLLSGHVVGNDASHAVLRKLGFADSHVATDPSAALGRDVQVQKVTLTQSQWRAAA